MHRNPNLMKRVLVLITLIFGSATLLATSPSDIPSIDTEIKAELDQDDKTLAVHIQYRQGPADFSTYPLMISVSIEHKEVSEDFSFEDQSWTLITETLDGEQSKQMIALRRGSDEIFSLDRDRLTLSGMVSLFACPEDAGSSEEMCIPCDVKEASCDFIFSMVREGAPYPAEKIQLKLSQWADEGAQFSLEASRR